jgi:hypothetical protein
MRYLLHAATRRARWLILKERVGVLRYGYDAAELYLALHYIAWALVMFLPEEATLRAPAWRYLRGLGLHDLGNGVLYTLLAVPLWLGVLRLLPTRLHLAALWATLSISVGLAVALWLGNPLAVSAYDSLITALICWLVYLRADRSGP